MLLPVAMIPYLSNPFQVQALIFFSTLYLLFASFANPHGAHLWQTSYPKKGEEAFFSKRGRIVGLVTVISAFLAGYILHLFKNNPLTGFTIHISFAMVSRYVSCYFLNKMYEPPLEIKREHYFFILQFCAKS